MLGARLSLYAIIFIAGFVLLCCIVGCVGRRLRWYSRDGCCGKRFCCCGGYAKQEGSTAQPAAVGLVEEADSENATSPLRSEDGSVGAKKAPEGDPKEETVEFDVQNPYWRDHENSVRGGDWEKVSDDAGNEYWYNSETNETSSEGPDSVEHGDTEAYSTGWHAEYEEAYGFTDDSGNPIQGRAASKDPNDDEDDGARTLDF